MPDQSLYERKFQSWPTRPEDSGNSGKTTRYTVERIQSLREVARNWVTSGSSSSNFEFWSKEMWEQEKLDEKQNTEIQLAWQTVTEILDFEPKFPLSKS